MLVPKEREKVALPWGMDWHRFVPGLLRLVPQTRDTAALRISAPALRPR
jgi:hypothetical protein